MAAADVLEALKAGGDMSQLEGREFFAEFFDPTDKLGSRCAQSQEPCGLAVLQPCRVILDDEEK